ncbi:MAG: hypothetical protein HQK53_07665 [Oligoflexia bacterium]|nr:hypothetical protein [Oligoflexia bacterium]
MHYKKVAGLACFLFISMFNSAVWGASAGTAAGTSAGDNHASNQSGVPERLLYGEGSKTDYLATPIDYDDVVRARKIVSFRVGKMDLDARIIAIKNRHIAVKGELMRQREAIQRAAHSRMRQLGMSLEELEEEKNRELEWRNAEHESRKEEAKRRLLAQQREGKERFLQFPGVSQLVERQRALASTHNEGAAKEMEDLDLQLNELKKAFATQEGIDLIAIRAELESIDNREDIELSNEIGRLNELFEKKRGEEEQRLISTPRETDEERNALEKLGEELACIEAQFTNEMESFKREKEEIRRRMMRTLLTENNPLEIMRLYEETLRAQRIEAANREMSMNTNQRADSFFRDLRDLRDPFFRESF